MLKLMRDAAYMRHYVLWVARGAIPQEWPWHLAVINAVYWMMNDDLC